MSSKQFNKTITSSTEPNGLVGDEWFNPTTNKLYKFLPVNKLAPQWCEIPQTNVPNNLSLVNVLSSGTASFTGSMSTMAFNAPNFVENVSLSASAPVGQLNFNVTGQTVMYVTGNSTGNFLVNIFGSDSVPLNNLLSVGQSVTCALMLTNGATGYFVTGVRVDGLAATVRWQGGTAPSSGNTSAVDAYTFVVVKTANATFNVFAASAKFA